MTIRAERHILNDRQHQRSQPSVKVRCLNGSTMQKLLRFFDFLNPTPTIVALFCAIVFPFIPPMNVLGFLGFLAMFLAARRHAHTFARFYRNHPFLWDFAIFFVSMLCLANRVHRPGTVIDSVALAGAGVLLGPWFWVHWNDEIYETLD